MSDHPIIFSGPISDLKRDEFMSLVMPEPNSGCWLWLGAINRNGYGRFSNGAHGMLMAHRVSLLLVGRERPDGMEVDHKCRVRCCVNPDHLEYVTHAENLRRGDTLSAIAARRTHCRAGHPLSGVNLMMRAGKRGCRECDRLRQIAAYKPEGKRRRRRHLKKAERTLILEMIALGHSHSAIAKAVNVSIATVSNVRNGKNRYDRPANNI